MSRALKKKKKKSDSSINNPVLFGYHAPPGTVICGSRVPWWAWWPHTGSASSRGNAGHRTETRSAWPPCRSLWWGSARSPGSSRVRSGWSRGLAQTRSHFLGSSMSNSLQQGRKEKIKSADSATVPLNTKNELFGAFAHAFLKLFHSLQHTSP